MILSPVHTEVVHRQQCLEQAARCRRLAYTLSDRQAANELLELAADYERNAWRTQHA